MILASIMLIPYYIGMKQPAKTHPKEYAAWANMKARCSNPKNNTYKHYGGRGIFVDESLSTFEGFLTALGKAPLGTSLDRIDNNGPYAVGNVRWADKLTQMSNRRANRLLTYNGESKTLAEWSRTLGISLQTIWARLNYGHSVERALSTKLLSAQEASALGHKARWG
jgi:hypothetical protein